jgi:hypothetical protein
MVASLRPGHRSANRTLLSCSPMESERQSSSRSSAGCIGSHGRRPSSGHQSRVSQQDHDRPTSTASNPSSLPTANLVGRANLERHRCSERDDDLAARLGLTNVAAKRRESLDCLVETVAVSDEE